MAPDLVTDPSTGLFSEAMLRAVLPSRVATARRTLRQLGLVLVMADDGPTPTEMAAFVTGAVRDSDITARLDDGTVALVLEFTPSEGCLVVVERLFGRVLAAHPAARVRAGVACYPAHAVSADELVLTALDALGRAQDGTAAVAAVPD